TFKRMIRNGKCDLCEDSVSEFTNNQLFWITYAQFNCENTNKEYELQIVLSDPHPLGEFRVIGPSSDNVDFAKSFKCGESTTMNPVEKCVFL
ncbi:hypothetical protein B4U80_14529, partial [Leptotrombidium deliense]